MSGKVLDPQKQAVRFWAKVEPEPNSGCWLWAGGGSPYGQFEKYGWRTSGNAHVFAYRLLVGEIPKGLELDHRCRNRQCVNPGHLETVTRRVNLLRGKTIPAAHAAKTHCPKGHAYEGENLGYQFPKNGGQTRLCRTCRRARDQARRGQG